MLPATVVLVHSPLATAAVWTEVAAKLSAAGPKVVVPQVTVDDVPPYASRFVAAVAQAISAAAAEPPVVLIGSREAGPLLPAIGFAQRAARRRVGGYIFVDTALPRAGTPSHLDLLAVEDAATAEDVHARLHEPGAVWPPDAARPRGHDFWTEPLPHPPDWPDAPCGYLHTGGYPIAAGVALSRAWTVVESDGDLAAGLSRLIAALPGC